MVPQVERTKNLFARFSCFNPSYYVARHPCDRSPYRPRPGEQSTLSQVLASQISVEPSAIPYEVDPLLTRLRSSQLFKPISGRGEADAEFKLRGAEEGSLKESPVDFLPPRVQSHCHRSCSPSQSGRPSGS
jgi:hypothetical protein